MPEDDLDTGLEGLLKTAVAQGARAIPTIATPSGGIAFLVPEGYSAKELPPVNPPLLDHIHQSAAFHDADSFIAYVNAFKTATTQLFAAPGFLNNGSAVISAALDYHAKDKPGRGTHNAAYSPRYSEQWTRWQKACAHPMKQVEFAEFIEEVRNDIREPSAAQLLDIVRTFKANKAVEFDTLVYQPDGGVKLNYSEKVTQSGSSGVLPEVMKIGIPVYYRDGLYEIAVFVRFKVSGGSVVFQLKLDRADVIEEEAFKLLAAKVEKDTSVKAYLGRRT
jgi:uncharacterized protein YfdQ (DUF2303 family)